MQKFKVIYNLGKGKDFVFVIAQNDFAAFMLVQAAFSIPKDKILSVTKVN